MNLRTEPSARAKLHALTGLRFFAAIYVVVYHVLPEHVHHMPAITGNVVRSGYVAVSLFFILSGYILAYNYVPAPASPSIDRRQFWAARFARIYPVYALSLLIALPRFLQLLAGEPVGGWGRVHDGVRTVGMSLVMLQAWFPSLAYRYNGPSWSLSAEAFFYLLFPFVVPLLCRPGIRRRPILIATLLWVISLGTVTAMARFAHSPIGHQTLSPSDWAAALVYMPIFRVPEFLVGVVLGIAQSDGKLAVSGRGARVLTITSLVLLALLLADARALPSLPLQTGLLTPVFAALILGLAASDGPVARVLSWPSLVLLGEASYSMYILHAPLHTWLRGIDLLDGGRLYASPFWVPVYVTLVVLLSVYSLRHIELPARRAIRRWLAPAPDSPTSTANSSVAIPAASSAASHC